MYKIMIVEDEPLERKVLKMMLKKNVVNLEILTDAKNAIEAIDYAKLYKPNIILMDIRMPEGSGLDAQKRIIKFLPDVKTIIITAYSDFNYAQEAIKNGAIDYLLKPIKPNELKASINHAIEAIQRTESERLAGLKHEKAPVNSLEAALKYIENNYNQKLTLDSVAEYVHLHPQYFSKYFKKEIGFTFTDYVSKLRIEKAKRLLSNTDKTITQISLEIGYIDPAYFSKVFAKFENKSPYKYRTSDK